MFKLGLCSVTFREMSIKEVISVCSEHGLEGIEWGGDIHLKPGAPLEFVAGVKEKCRDAGLVTPSYGSYFDVMEQEPEEFEHILERALVLEADTIRVWPGWVRPENISGYQLEKLTHTSKRIAEMAVVRNIRVAYEFHDHTPTEGGEALLSLLERVRHPNLYTYYQLIRPEETEWNLNNLDQIYDRLAYIHVQANDYKRNLPLADFREVWQKIIERLKARGYDGWLLFEFNKDNSVGQLEQDLALIRSFIGSKTDTGGRCAES
ncbi:MAG: sugar phosphate isomerase/epimerase [Candidatus Glassbacteria bacterium]|nr:sugar phosphate isomerase/epimerase [Candidatus Glassbacteria bacterium]